MLREEHGSQQGLWWSLSPLIAGRDRVRVGRFNGRRKKWEYPASGERDLTAVVPSAPAAVMLYDSRGLCRTLVIDVDVEGVDGVDLVHEVLWLLQHVGANTVVDRSPAGRHHVYVPLRDGLSVQDASELARAFAKRFVGVDPMPHITGAVSGCIRTPGSVHKDGGVQELVTDFQAARRALLVRNGSDVVAGLREALSEEIALVRREAMALAAPSAGGEDAVVEAAFTGRVLSERLVVLAREGDFVSAGYRSASEGRMAVLCGAVRAGMSYADVVMRIEDGRWPGLASLFSSAVQRARLLNREWRKAQVFVAASGPGVKRVRSCNTSGGEVTRGASAAPSDGVRAAHAQLRVLRSVLGAVEVEEFRGRSGLIARFLLRALIAAAHSTGSVRVSFGVRSLALGVGVDPSTVARGLQVLRDCEDPWLVLVDRAEGRKADVYELRVPERHRERAEGVSGARGKIYGLRPVFRELGAVAALVFEAIERGESSVSGIAAVSGVARSSVYDVLGVLEAWDLVQRGEDGELIACPERLERAAELLGCLVVVAVLVERFRRERRLWVAFLSRHRADEGWWSSLMDTGPPPSWRESLAA